jgi:hypothetical protein
MDIAIVVAALKEQRTRIDHAIAALEGVSSPGRRGRPSKAAATTGRQISAAARKRISEAMKQRWAKWKRKSSPKKSVPAKTKARPTMSAAARKKLSGLMKARWAAKQKAKA